MTTTEITTPQDNQTADAIREQAGTLQPLAGMLIAAGLPRVGSATVARVLDALEIDGTTGITAEQGGRLAKWQDRKKGLTGRALVEWIVTGHGTTEQAATARAKTPAATPAAPKATAKKSGAKKATPAKTPRARASVAKAKSPAEQADLDAARVAFDETGKGRTAKPISQRPTSKEIAKARKVLAKMDGDTVLTKLSISEAKLRAFVRGDTAIGDLNGGRAGVQALTSGIASHQVWARKAAAIAWGIHKTA